MIIPTLLAAAESGPDPVNEVLRYTLFRIGGANGFGVTNQMFMALVAAALMLLVFPAIFARADGSPPTGSRNFFESILEFLRLEVFRPALKEHTDRFVPFLWTLFFFILFCNLLGQIPVEAIITLFTRQESHAWGTATGTPTTTGALAVCAFVFIHLNGVLQVARSLIDGTYGHHGHHEEHSSDGNGGHPAAHDLEHMRGEAIAADVPGDLRAIGNPAAHYNDDKYAGARAQGSWHDDGPIIHMNPVAAVLMAVPLYLWNFAPHPFKPGPEASGISRLLLTVVDVLMWGFLLLLEMIGALIKPFALMIRLFANMIAGHIVIASLILMIPVTAGFARHFGIALPVVLLSLLIRVLELFVSVLQAYIFTFLTTLFIASAVAPEH